MIALGAKMAKADGLVTRNEVSAFREVFQINEADAASAARVFNLARQDVAGFEDYANRIRRLFRDEPEALCDLFEGLFHIAVADGSYHPAENDFLARVAAIFGLSERRFRAVRTRFVPDAEPDPWDVLGVDRDAPPETVRAAWRRLVRETHPDRMAARGVPPEAVRLAEKRLVAVNRAYEAITTRRAAVG